MRILVTGAAGLIGSHLCDELLKRGHAIIGLDDLSFGNEENLKDAKTFDTFTFINIDVRYMRLDITFTDIDLIIHLAADKKAPKGETKASAILMNNFEMMDSVIRTAEDNNNCPILFTSTSDVYSNHPTFKESDPITIGPTNIERYSYAMSKLFDEQYLLNKISEGDASGTVFRLFGVYSERSNKGWSGGHIPIFIDKALKGEDIVIHGDGLQTRSMTHISDVMKAFISYIDKMDDLNGEIINIGSDEQISVRTAAEKIISFTKSNSKIVHIDPKELHGDYPEIKNRWANLDKAKDLLGYNYKVKFDRGIKRVINELKKESRSSASTVQKV